MLDRLGTSRKNVKKARIAGSRMTPALDSGDFISPSPAENLSRTPSATRQNTPFYCGSQRTVEESSAATMVNEVHLASGESCKGHRGSCQSTTPTLLVKRVEARVISSMGLTNECRQHSVQGHQLDRECQAPGENFVLQLAG